MKIHNILLSAALLVPLAIPLTAAPKEAKGTKAEKAPFVLKDVPPILDFTEIQDKGGKYIDKTGNGILTGGETMKIAEGPFGGQAFEFDGLKTSVATLDMSKVGKKLDGFDYAISFWFKAEPQDTKNKPLLSGNNTGLGVEISGASAKFGAPTVGPGSINNWFPLIEHDWNHVAFIYSLHNKIKILYVNGYPVINQKGYGKFYPLVGNTSGKFRIGSFKGLIADLKIWEAPIPGEQFKNMEITAKNAENLRARIRKLKADGNGTNGTNIMAEVLSKDLEEAIAKKNVPIDDYNAITRRLKVAEQLVAASKAMSTTTMKDAPYAFFQARTISPEIRTPDKFPSNPSYTDTLKSVSAKDEYSSVTFFIYPYRDLKDIEFELSDLKSDNGGVIPVSEMEMFFVQCWYQAGWNSYFNGTGNYVPGLLLRDPTLLKIDKRNKRNLLRIDYGGKPEYFNITHWGSVLKSPEFKWMFEPVCDADKLLPCPGEFGQNRQFWIDIHVPKTAKAGTYTGKVQAKVAGKNVGYFTISMKVLPFVLPLPKTQFDHQEPFSQNIANSRQLGACVKDLKSRKAGEEMARKHMINLMKHGIVAQAIGFSYNADEFEWTVNEMRKLGLPVLWVDGDITKDSFTTPGEKVDLNKCDLKADIVRMDKQTAYVLQEVKRLGIDPKNVYFYGIDEAQDAGTLRMQAAYRDQVFRKGMRTCSTGWEDNFLNLPAYETYHTTAAFVDRKNAERWHAIGNQITAYCAPFIGPDNPDLMRGTHGLKPFRCNYNGWWELAYCADKYHAWNDLYGYDTTYRTFRVTIATYKGPTINTVAFCGLRDGQNDVRYATVMYQLADECFASGKPENMVVARRAIGWFRELPFPDSGDLDKARAGMTYHILAMMKQLGKEMN